METTTADTNQPAPYNETRVAASGTISMGGDGASVRLRGP